MGESGVDAGAGLAAAGFFFFFNLCICLISLTMTIINSECDHDELYDCLRAGGGRSRQYQV